MSDMFPPTRDEVIAELERELEMRRRVYPRWAEQGKIKPETADRRIELLVKAIELLR